MSTSSADNPPARRPTSLGDLPRELKGVIARLASAQDHQYCERVEAYTSEEWDTLPSGCDWNGRSLVALRSLSREWRSCADVEFFKDVTSRGCSDDIFTFDIVRRYGTSVTGVRFAAGATFEDQVSLLRFLPHFKNLERMVFDFKPFLLLFGVGSETPTDKQARYRDAMIASATQIEDLALPDLSPDSLAWVLPPFTQLRALELDLDDTEDTCTAVEVIANFYHLRKLGLYNMETTAAAALEDTVDTGRWKSNELSSFDFSSTHDAFTGGVWTFVEHFADTLVALDPMITDLVAESLPAFGEYVRARSSAFPQLRRLDLWGTLEHISSQISLIKAAPLASLHIHLDRESKSTHSHSEARAALNDLHRTLARFCHLRLIIYPNGSRSYTGPSTVANFTQLTRRPGISLSIPRPYDTFLHRKGTDVGVRQKETGTRCDGVDDVLRHMLAESGRMRATEDLEGAETLVELLTPLRAKMLRDKD